jgi:hypothetical protein
VELRLPLSSGVPRGVVLQANFFVSNSVSSAVLVLAMVHCMRSAHFLLLRQPLQQTETEALEPNFELAVRGLRATSNKARRIFEPWGREIARSADTAKCTDLVSRLMVTVKTHKNPVTVRLIHSSVNSCFNGLGAALNRVLQPKLIGLSHLCTCSEDVAEKLAGLPTTASCLLLKLDISDFYLTGEHEFITAEVGASIVDRDERQFVLSSLRVLFPLQFVSHNFDPGSELHTVYRVEQGSGIGLKHAGAVSDWLFWVRVEKGLLQRKAALGVLMYLRFRDDLFVVLEGINFSPGAVHRAPPVGIGIAAGPGPDSPKNVPGPAGPGPDFKKALPGLSGRAGFGPKQRISLVNKKSGPSPDTPGQGGQEKHTKH